jgi:predicted phosphodiesterase
VTSRAKRVKEALVAVPTARLERDLAVARERVKDLTDAVAKAQRRIALLEHFGKFADVEVPPWSRGKRRTGLYHATPCLLLSDLHFDEVVEPRQVEGLNAYNREIAVLRLKHCFERTVYFARDFLAGVKYDGFTLFLGGDIFSGDIHEELSETNEDTLFGSLLFWIEKLAQMLAGLAAEFGRVHVVGVAGNHGRMTRKPRAKYYARDNLDWLLYMLLARELRDDSRFTWNIPESRDADTVIYQTRIRLTHGDEARGGSGISGKQTPLALLDHRKTRRITQARQEPYHVLLYGHWHEFDPGERRLGNGSLKGIDEYSLGGEFGFEAPKQAFFLLTPEHGVSLKAPIFCAAKRKAEHW